MTTLYNMARMTTTTSGTGTVTLGSAVASFLTFAQAGVQNGDVVSYVIEDGNGTGREVGTGTYATSGTTLTRTPITSTNSNAAINLSGVAQVAITALKTDIINKTGDTMTGALNWATAVTVSSATSTAIGAAASNYVIISGTATITSFDTIAQGAFRWVRASGAFTLTHNGTSLILPNAVNIIAVAGDTFLAVSEGSGNWRVFYYNRATGIYIDNAGKVGIGTAAPVVKTQISYDGSTPASALYNATDDALLVTNSGAGAQIRVVAAGGASGAGLLGLFAKGTLASPTAVAANDTLISLVGQGYDGAARRSSAEIDFNVDGSVSGGIVPGRLTFWTTNTSGTLTERMRIDSAGNVGITGAVTGTGSFTSTVAPSSDWHYKNTSTPLAIAVDGTYDLASGNSGLVVMMNASATVCSAIVFCAVGTTTIISDPQAKFSTTSGTGSKINVFFTGSVYRIENKFAETLNLYVLALSARPSV